MKVGFKLSDVKEKGEFVNVAPAYLQVGDKVRYNDRVWTVLAIDTARDYIQLEN